MGDGGGGFSDEEIEEANQFIKDNHLLALVEVTEPIDDEIKCTFITKY